jgi:hypothetical protein
VLGGTNEGGSQLMGIVKQVLLLSLLFCSILFKSLACEYDQRSQQTILTFPSKMDSINPELEYTYELLKRIVQNSVERYGPCKLVLSRQKTPLKRIERQLELGQNIDVAAFTVSSQRDKRFLAVPIPISMGLRGYRLLLIKEGEQNRFDGIRTVNELAIMTAGVGHGWMDSKIMRYNALPVLEAGSIPTIIDMLTHSRFDYFPRGALEAVTEINRYSKKRIALEKQLLLVYPSLSVLYVNKTNSKLLERLTYGLQRMLDSGAFSQFFDSHPTSRKAKSILNVNNRKLIYLCNPYLPSWVPLQTSNYWLLPWPEHVYPENCT